MKPLDAQTHYETLEVGPEASAEEIERAYRVVRASYADESMALYSVFDASDAAAIRARIDEAYRVLSDPETRRDYDAWLGSEASDERRAGSGAATAAAPGTASMAVLDDLVEDEDAEQPWGGPRLRRARLRRGIEIDQIAAVTKINPTYLRLIEDEGFDGLPAAVYVRGFVTAYARAIGLEPGPVASDFMARMDEAGGPRRSSRFLGRR